MAAKKQYWLMKSEPNTFSFDDLKAAPDRREPWDGIRNYQARNFMMKEMRVGDEVLFYHSSCPQPGVVGVAKVASEAYPDPTAWDRNSQYFDPKSSKEKPRWYMVDIEWLGDFKRFVPLSDIREVKELQDMKLLQKGQRLSIQPVTAAEFLMIRKMGS